MHRNLVKTLEKKYLGGAECWIEDNIEMSLI